MLKDDEKNKIMVDGEYRKERVRNKANEIAAKAAEKIHGKAEYLNNQINALVYKKINILRSPCPKAELLKKAKDAYRENRKNLLFNELLVPFLNIAQKKETPTLSFEDIRLPIDLLKVAFCIFTEKEIEAAVEALPDNGLSKAEIKAEVERVDAEIEELASQIEAAPKTDASPRIKPNGN